MAAGASYNHGLGAGKDAFGSLGRGEFHDKLAELTSASEKDGSSRGPVRRALARLVLRNPAEAPTEEIAAQPENLSESATAMPTDTHTPQLHEVGSTVALEAPTPQAPPEDILPPAPRV